MGLEIPMRDLRLMDPALAAWESFAQILVSQPSMHALVGCWFGPRRGGAAGSRRCHVGGRRHCARPCVGSLGELDTHTCSQVSPVCV
jgi:hypothetical protein